MSGDSWRVERERELTASSKQVVYFVAGVCVVYDVESNIQRFFRGHTNDVLCIAKHLNGVWFASGQAGASPTICVWDSETPEVMIGKSTSVKSLRCLSSLCLPDARGVCSVCFTADEDHLVSVSDDVFHTITVWDWRKACPVVSARGDINKTLMVACNPYDYASDGLGTVVTCGIKHVKFWTIVDGQLVGTKGEYAGVSSFCNILNIAFTPRFTLTGTQDGMVYVWEKGVLHTVLKHAAECPVFGLCSVQDTRVHEHESEPSHFILTGGRDGVIRVWDHDLKPVEVGGIDMRKAADKLTALATVESLSIHSLSVECRSDHDWPFRFLVGTSSNEIFEITTKHVWSNIWSVDDKPASAPDMEITREVTPYLKVYDRNKVSETNVPAVQLLAMGHTPGLVSAGASTSQAQQSKESLNVSRLQQNTTTAFQLRAVAAHPYNENHFATCGGDAVLRIWSAETRRALAVHQVCLPWC